MNIKRSYRLYTIGDIEDEEVSVLVDSLNQGLTDRYGHDYKLEVKNLFGEDNIQHAIRDGVFSIPAFLKRLPKPVKQVIGNLSNTHEVLLLLE